MYCGYNGSFNEDLLSDLLGLFALNRLREYMKPLRDLRHHPSLSIFLHTLSASSLIYLPILSSLDSFLFPSGSETDLPYSLSPFLCQPRMGNLKYESVYSALEIPADIDDKISSPSLSPCTGSPSRVSCHHPSLSSPRHFCSTQFSA